MKSVIPNNSNVYYQGEYWNDIPEVYEYINNKCNFENPSSWVIDFKNRYAKKPFKNALFICCGNGWIDRTFIDENITVEADAFDYSKDLLKEAKKLKGDRKIHYFHADANKLAFPSEKYDLIVNVAGLHHVQYINKFSAELAKTLKTNGLFVHYDYIGPRRNQYSRSQWKIAKRVNSILPRYIQLDNMAYPDLPTMMLSDPTEAIHSDLIINILKRYFVFKERHDINGGLAYLLLTHNPKIKFLKPSIRKKVISKILLLDELLSKQKKVPVMFGYMIVKANKAILKDKKLLRKYQNEENIREYIAEKRRGCYSWYEYAIVVLNPIIYRIRVALFNTRKKFHGSIHA